MKRVQLTAAKSGQSQHKYLVILAEKDGIDRLNDALLPSEISFLRPGIEREVSHFFFPRAEGCVFVRLLKNDGDAAAAAENARLAGNEMLRELRQYRIETVAIRNACVQDRSLAFAEGLALGSYQFLKYFTESEKKEKPLREIAVEGASQADIAELNALLEAVFLARDMVNEPQSHSTPSSWPPRWNPPENSTGSRSKFWKKKRSKASKWAAFSP